MSILPERHPNVTRTAGLTIIPTTSAIGAEIRGVDLARPFSPEVADAIHRALLDHEVIYFRDLELSTERHLELARLFGEPAYSKKLPMYDGLPNVSLLENDGSQLAVGGAWHADNTDFLNPPMGSLLYAEQVPTVGGDTVFCSTTAAYEALSPGMRNHLLALTAFHDNSRVRLLYAEAGALRSEGVVVDEPVEHAVVKAHPETGRLGIFVNSAYTTRIAGVPEVESRHLLAMLYEHLMRPEFQMRLHWEPATLAIWDNRATQHYALDDYSELRRMRRVQIQGDTPAGTGSPRRSRT